MFRAEACGLLARLLSLRHQHYCGGRETGDKKEARSRNRVKYFPHCACGYSSNNRDNDGARVAFDHAAQAIEALRRGGRTREATMAEAFLHVVQGRSDEAILALKRLVEKPELPFSGWTAPIEPLFAPLRDRSDFREILAILTHNAR